MVSYVEPFAVKSLPSPWRRWLRFEELDSTQLEAERMVAAGEDLRGVAIQAERQSAGRGRLGHAWISDAGGLYVTAGLPFDPPFPPADVGWISLLAALACVEALEREVGLGVQIKWPNDLFLAGRKIGGLLGEVKNLAPAGGPERLILIGLGLNWFNRIGPTACAGGFAAASLADFLDPLTLEGREQFGLAWLERLNTWREGMVRDYNGAVTKLSGAVEAVLWKRGEFVRLERTERGMVEGVLLGLGSGGAARMALAGGDEVQVHCGWQAAGKMVKGEV